MKYKGLIRKPNIKVQKRDSHHMLVNMADSDNHILGSVAHKDNITR